MKCSPLFVLMLALTLSACNSAASTSTGIPSQSLAATVTPLPVTETFLPSTQTSEPLTQLAGSLTFSELHMFDENNGWAWAQASDSSAYLFRTTDGGRTWSDQAPHGLGFSQYGSFFLDGQTAWLQAFDSTTNQQGLLRTTDGGQTWTLCPQNPKPSSSNNFISANYGWQEVLDVGAGNLYISLFDTHNGGMTWQPIIVIPPQLESGLPAGVIHLCNMCGDVAYYDPARVILVHGNMNIDMNFDTIAVETSFNLGKSWNQLKLTLPDPKYSHFEPLFIRFADDENGYLGVGLFESASATTSKALAVYATQDGGVTWVSKSVLETSVYLYRSQQLEDVVSAQDIFLRCGEKLCATNDGGLNWQVIQSNWEKLGAFDFVSAMTGFGLVSRDGVQFVFAKTTDGGLTWTEITSVFDR
jgi:photosystem II stability/assembly factor-like uncharacterized protein